MRLHGPNLAERVGVLLLSLGLVAGVALRLKIFLMNRALWLDPAALALNVVDTGLLELFAKLPYHNQSAPIGFLLVSKFLGSLFDYSEYSLTLFSLVLSIGTLGLFLRLTRDLLGPTAAPLAFLPLCLSSTAIYYASEFKQYSADLFFAVLVLVVALQTKRSGFSNRWLLTLGAVGVVSVWFSFTAILTVAGSGIALFLASLVSEDRKATRRISSVGVVIAAHFLLLYFSQVRPSLPSRIFGYWEVAYPTLPFSKTGIDWWTSATIGYFEFPLGFDSSLGIPLLGVALGLVTLGFTKQKRFETLLLLLPMLLLLIVAALEFYPLTTGRHEMRSRFTLFTTPFASTTIRCSYFDGAEGHAAGVGYSIAHKHQLWWSPQDPEQQPLWNSVVVLSSEFYDELVAHAVPIDLRALKRSRARPWP